MSNVKSPFLFEIFTTKDGSPTLSLSGGEKMHSMEGALSESLFVYGDSLSIALNSTPSPKVLSMGLGLAYNEIVTLAMTLKKGSDDFQITSFESVEFLRESLIKFITGDDSPLNKLYDQIFSLVSNHFDLEPSSLRAQAKEAFKTEKWLIEAALTSKNKDPYLFNVIFFDAFSSSTDQSLWTEEFFHNFFHEYCAAKDCWFSTYAATGNLRRALVSAEFNLQKKSGFGNKRESTFAYR